MKYRKGFKYQLHTDYKCQTDIRPDYDINLDFISLSKSGVLKIRKGYAWDGTSGPVIDRKTNMIASLKHDALYELMRQSVLPYHFWEMADREFAKTLREHGAWEITIKIDLLGLKLANGAAAHPMNIRKVYSVYF